MNVLECWVLPFCKFKLVCVAQCAVAVVTAGQWTSEIWEAVVSLGWTGSAPGPNCPHCIGQMYSVDKPPTSLCCQKKSWFSNTGLFSLLSSWQEADPYPGWSSGGLQLPHLSQRQLRSADSYVVVKCPVMLSFVACGLTVYHHMPQAARVSVRNAVLPLAYCKVNMSSFSLCIWARSEAD